MALGCLTRNRGCQTSNRPDWRAALLMVVLALCGGLPAWGQAQNTGGIYGTVVDPSGAVIAGAQVIANEPNKGVTRTVTSAKNGDFLVSSLPVGVYTLTVTAAGFQTFLAESITVDADASVKIAAKMTIGDKGETVQVNEEGTTIDTRSAQLGTLIDNKLVEDLPVDGRNVVALAGLLPGVTDLNAPATNTSDRGGPTYSVSGSRNTQNLMLFDGLMWNNLFFNTGINYPPPNGLQEISVLLNNFKAQYGRNAGSVFNVLTKSGTNTVHGAVWDYVQNKVFNAADYMTHRNPKDNSNQFGFTVGGPIIRDKLFYQLTFQDLIQRLEAIGSAQTPGLAERGLSADGVTPLLCTPGPYAPGTTCASFATDITSVNSSGAVAYAKLINPVQVGSTSGLQVTPADAIAMFNSAAAQANDPNNQCVPLLNQAAVYAASHPYFTGSPQASYLPYAEVPTACLNPVILAIEKKYMPVPNSFSTAGTPVAVTSAPQPRNDKNVLARIDWTASQRHTIDARYNLILADDATAPGVTSASVGIANYELSANSAVSNFGNIADTWVLSPNVLNVLRVGYKRYTVANPPLNNDTLNTFGGNFVEPGVPVMPVISISNVFTFGSTAQAQASVVNENIEMLEQLSWTHKSHSFQFGANFLRLQYLDRSDYPGTLSFSSTFTGLSIADLQQGLLNSVQANSALVQGGVQHMIVGYAQDDWRATPKLTLNLGVRYELPFQWYQPNGYSSTFIAGHQSTVFPNAVAGLAFPGDPGVLPSLVPTDFNGIVPRIGLAYDVFGNGNFAIRAGFGMFFDAINADVVGEGEPFYYRFTKNVPPGGLSVPLATYGPNGGILQVPNGYDKANPQFVAPYSLFFPDRNFRTPYYEGMNAGFEWRPLRAGVLDVNYVGKFGRKLTIPFDLNPAIYDCSGGYFQVKPNLYCNGASSNTPSTQARLRFTPFNYGGNGLVDFASIGTSNYNGLQVQYTQRGGKLLTIIASYTYSKAIDLQTQSQSTSNAIPNVFNVNSERGLSDYDARHIFNMGWSLNLPRITTGSALERAVFNNWIYAGKFITHTGRPFNVTLNNDTALDGEPNQRAELVPGVPVKLPGNRHRIDKTKEYFNVYAFTYPTVGTFSKVPRNNFIGPGYIQTDMSLGRTFPLHMREGMKFAFRAEAYNVFNTPNLANPQTKFSCSTTSTNGGSCPTVPNSTFGQILSTFGNNANTSTNGRKMQFSGTVYF